MNKTEQKNNKKKLQGRVVSDAMDKTIVVAVETLKTHKKYNKKFISTKKYKVHDEENSKKVGELVSIIECSPISKDKTFKIIE